VFGLLINGFKRFEKFRKWAIKTRESTMKKYSSNDVKLLDKKVCDCLYSWNRKRVFAGGIVDSEADKFRSWYYMDKFLHEMSQLYTVFYEWDDETILNEFSASVEERMALKEYRNTIAHVDDDIEETFKRLTDYFSTWNTTNLSKDLFLMIKYLRNVAATVGLQERVRGRLIMVQNIFPAETFPEVIRKDIFG
jgi:hypothetical protein